MARDFVKFPELRNYELATEYWNSPHKQIVEDFKCKVIEVKDGDTIQVRWSERDFDFPVRFIDIDAPELSEGGETSKESLTNLIQGEEVDILINPFRRVEKFGRILGRVIHRGIDVNEYMVNSSLAVPFSQRNEGKIQDINEMIEVL